MKLYDISLVVVGKAKSATWDMIIDLNLLTDKLSILVAYTL